MRRKAADCLQHYRKRSPIPFFMILCLFLAFRMLSIPLWNSDALVTVRAIQKQLRSGILWGVYLYAAYLIISAGFKAWTSAGFLALLVLMAHLCQKPIKNSANFEIFMTAVLISLSYGRSFHRILSYMLIAHATGLSTALCGYYMGLTNVNNKVEAYGEGLALGTGHPNTLALMVFDILILFWYLFLRNRKKSLTFLIFWLPIFPLVFITKCRTITVMMFLFPVCEGISRWISERRAAGKTSQVRIGWIAGILILTPVMCWIFTFLMAMQMEALARLTKGTFFQNLFVRFIQAGIAIKEYGLSLFPQHVVLDGSVYAILNGSVYKLLILDNAYCFFTLEYGLPYIVTTLAWFCLANRRCLKESDYALLVISFFISIYGLMEKYPMWI